MSFSHSLPACPMPSVKANPRYSLGWGGQEFGGTQGKRVPGRELEPILLPDL